MSLRQEEAPRAKNRRGRPRSEPGETSTRERIVTAALDLFAEKGFDGTSIREIGAAAGVTSAALYVHYPSKKEILAEVLSRFGPMRIETILRGFDLQKALQDPLAFVRQAVMQVCDIWSTPEDCKLNRILMVELHRIREDPELRASILESQQGSPQQVLELLRVAVTYLMEKGVFRKMDIDLVVREFLFPILHMRLTLTDVNGSFDPQVFRQFAEAHLDFFFDAMTPR